MILTPAKILADVVEIIEERRQDVVADREKVGRERLAELHLHVGTVLVDAEAIGANVLEPQGDHGANPNSGQDLPAHAQA
jgi:hypothetical protein